MRLWKRDAKSKFKELVKGEEYREINSLVDKDTNILVQLASLLEDKDSQVRGKAASALAEAVIMHDDFYFGELEDIVVLRIIKLLKDSTPEVRREAALTVSGLPSRAYCGISKKEPELIEQAIPQLLRLLEDKDSRVQRSAGTSLFAATYWLLENQKEVKAALDILSKLTEHRDIRNRKDAAYFWVRHSKKFPEAAREATPTLMELTKDSDEEVRRYAESALESTEET